MDNYIVPEFVTAEQIKSARNELGLTQKEFAKLIGVSKPTVERWETSDKAIRGPIVLLLELLDKDYIEKRSIPPKILPTRLIYMYMNDICTIIDVDEKSRKVSIKNYTDRLQYRAFGVNENPTFEDYEDFLESRCFPKTRDKMKIILEDLDLPFYDPFMIIKKTEGKMAEDNFWIKVE